MCSLHHQDSSRLDRLNPPRNALSALQAMLSDSQLRDQCERTLGQQPGHLPMQPGSMSFVPSQAFATEYGKLEREILFHLGSYQQLETEEDTGQSFPTITLNITGLLLTVRARRPIEQGQSTHLILLPKPFSKSQLGSSW